ncbi:hypothetical protein [Microbispora catharanthi]|uniref:hypothetical protein n=1 Tax=Microbispora catharanthi TaxID=1712871 RepID=UPI001378DA6B|nr:hypothetical protein [Microbispora catharanthi]
MDHPPARHRRPRVHPRRFGHAEAVEVVVQDDDVGRRAPPWAPGAASRPVGDEPTRRH